jgi:glycosyltransferase involved in cell wall biosynthesis
MEVVYQGVDPAQFYPEGGLNLRKPAVAIIQNHTIYGKVAGLLSFRGVMASLPEIQFYISEGEDVERSLLPIIKQHLSDLPNVHFVAGISSTGAVRSMLTACDCYVLASGLDCCPTTVLEASLMSKPVIASKVGGVPEIVLENETGWTVRNDQASRWVEKIRLLANDTRLSRVLGHKGHEWVAENFSWRTIARQVEGILIREAN